MKKTSFGSIDQILQVNDKVVAEYLVFEKEGRSHQHKEYETFAVLSGTGKIVSGETTYSVNPGDLVCIPPNTSHWMIPSQDQIMTGILWYGETPSKLY